MQADGVDIAGVLDEVGNDWQLTIARLKVWDLTEGQGGKEKGGECHVNQVNLRRLSD